MVKDTFSIIPTIVLENELLSPADKLIFSVLFGFRLTQKCWASNNYISEKTKISIPTVNRSLKTLEKYGFISRVTTQEGMIKKREIVISEIEDIGINLSEAQNDTSHDQNDQTTNQNDHLSMIKMISTPNQNDQSIDNIINNIIHKPADQKEPCIIDNEGNKSEFVRLSKKDKEKLKQVYEDNFGHEYLRVMRQAVIALDEWFRENPKKLKASKNHLTRLTGKGLEFAQNAESARIGFKNKKIMQEKMESRYDNK